MVGLTLLCLALFAPDPGAAAPKPSPTASDRAAYESARREAARDPDAHLRLALWCESHGLLAERTRHLALAVRLRPDFAAARGLLGLVRYEDRWLRPDDVGQEVEADARLAEALAEYARRRDGMAETAEAHWRLGVWCEQNGLAAEAKAHFTTVVRLDPGRDAAWRRLGCKKVDGRWVNDDVLAAERAEARAQARADREWRPRLARWRDALKVRDEGRRAEARDALAAVTDPRAVHAVWAVFARGDAASQGLAVQLLGQIDARDASRALAVMAAESPSAEARRAAAETLRSRDPREFADVLIARLDREIAYEVRPVGGPGSPGALFIEGQQVNLRRVYAPPLAPAIQPMPGDQVVLDDAGLPAIVRPTGRSRIDTTGMDDRYGVDAVVGRVGELNPAKLPESLTRAMPAELVNRIEASRQANLDSQLGALRSQIAADAATFGANFYVEQRVKQTEFEVIPIGRMAVEARRSAEVAQQQLQQDVAALDRRNAEVRVRNDGILPILREVSGRDLGTDRDAWQGWWIDQLGLTARTSDPTRIRPTLDQQVPLGYVPDVPIERVTSVESGVAIVRHSCFGAGTLVRTRTGPRPIETLRVGDQVLTLETDSGALGYRPIVQVFHNPPSPTYRIRLRGDAVVSSPSHRFWKVGKGWIMARDLQPGDVLRTLDGPAAVEAVEEGKVQPVFNLDVAEHADFFAGSAAALVHDNTLPDTRQAPFDAPPALAAGHAAEE